MERVPIVNPQDSGAGRAALERGDWQAARVAFETSLTTAADPEALEGLGLAAWWLDLADVVFDARERAYRLYRERGDSLGAARMAIWLAWDTEAFRGEHAIANGWLQRARRLLEDRPDATEHAWLALRSGAFALLDDGDPDVSEKLASEAIRIGQALGAADYEMVGRALHGFSRVTAGRVAEGLQELDEVNAAVLAGEMHDRVLIGLTCCYLIAACERIHDYERAVQWCDRLKAFCEKWGLRPLFAVCRTQYASVCMWRGAWEEAERELTSASDELAASRPAMTGEGLVRLGELRRRQGKLDEAMSLFERSGSHPLASLGRASVIFDRGDFSNGADLAERHLRRLPAKNRTERAAALELMVRACLEQGRTDEAAVAVAELHAIGEEAGTGPLRAL
ncbi:MAG: helix-turn-helix transcriptional regulator, partial [Vicinamibacterales bacterium]